MYMASKTNERLNIISVASPTCDLQNKKNCKCAPGTEYRNGSCIRLDLLIEMVRAYNEELAESGKESIKIDTKQETLNPDKYQHYL